MKLNGIYGKGTGKLGNSVFAVSGGVQLMREYNPNVSNPNTDAQVNQRAKFKLMSQLAADLASVIVIPKSGLVSARNQFVSKNIALATSENGEASINYVNVQLTASEAAFPAVTGSIDESGNLGVKLAKMPAADVQKVVYCVFAKDDTNQLSLIGTTIIDRSEATNNFAYTFEGASDAYVAYAYGIKASAVAANPNYDNYEIAGATDIARLVAARSISLDASGTTRTSGVLVAAGAVRATSVVIGDNEFGPYEAGALAGPCSFDDTRPVIVTMSADVEGASVSNVKITCSNEGDVITTTIDNARVSGSSVRISPDDVQGASNVYITEISFDLDGVNHGIRFAQP